MKTILVTTDLSDESKVAFSVARDYAKALGAKIVLLSVIEDPSQAAMVYALDFPVYPDPDIYKQLVGRINSELKNLCQTHFADVPNEYIVREAAGAVYSEIAQFGKERGVELIIMGTHGRTGVSRILLGSVTERVIREASCPVLTVPAKSR